MRVTAAMPGIPMTMAGRIIRTSKNPPQPLTGSRSNFRENRMSSPGAVRNIGTDMNIRVTATVVVSSQLPCFRAAKNPSGTPRPRDTIIAAMAS